MRGVEVEADHEWLGRFGVSVDDLDGARAEHLGEVAVLVDGDIVVPEVVSIAVLVRVVVDGAAAETIEMIVAALERTEVRQQAEMPLADKGGAVAGLLQ